MVQFSKSNSIHSQIPHYLHRHCAIFRSLLRLQLVQYGFLPRSLDIVFHVVVVRELVRVRLLLFRHDLQSGDHGARTSMAEAAPDQRAITVLLPFRVALFELFRRGGVTVLHLERRVRNARGPQRVGHGDGGVVGRPVETDDMFDVLLVQKGNGFGVQALVAITRFVVRS